MGLIVFEALNVQDPVGWRFKSIGDASLFFNWFVKCK